MKKAWESFSAVDRFFDPLLRQEVNRWILLMPTMNLCHWYLKTGGCSMCGFNGPCSSKRSYAWITKYFGGRALDMLYRIGYWGVKNQNPQNLTIYNGGSFFNSGQEVVGAKPEIPYTLQEAVFRHIGQHPTIQKLCVESRPEFIADGNIAPLTKLLNGKDLLVGIGLESSNDRIRNSILKKGMGRCEFERSLDVLKSHGAKSLAYVFLKPMGVSEKEAVTDTVRTIEYCFANGVDEVSLSCAFIQDGTPMAAQYRANLYRPPWLWSIIEVVEKTNHLGPVRVGTFEDDPPPLDVAHNCPKCSELVAMAIDQYRHTFDLSVFNKLTCPCRETWQEEMSAQ